jgi:hypothetical protein
MFKPDIHEAAGPVRRPYSTHLPDTEPAPSQLRYLLFNPPNTHEAAGPARRSHITHLPDIEPARSYWRLGSDMC